MSRCQFCKAQVRFVPTPSGATMPLDFNQSPDGNVEVRDGRAHVMTKAEIEQAVSEEPRPRWMPHFASCEPSRRHWDDERRIAARAARRAPERPAAEIIDLDRWRARADLT